METKLKKLKELTDNIKKVIECHPNTEASIIELKKIEEFTNFRMSLIEESDRGCVLMATAFIEDKITYMVQDKNVQKNIFEGNGAIGTFSSKIDLAFLLGLIPKITYLKKNKK